MKSETMLFAGEWGRTLRLVVLGAAVLGAANCKAVPATRIDAHKPTATGNPAPQGSAPSIWRNVQIVAGGFVDGLVFNPAARDVLYARTDIGGAYRWNAAAQRWIPLLDWLSPTDWNLTGVESIGVDPSDARRVYLAVGTYTNDWAGNGAILRSSDQGRTWQRTDLPFKNGGNMEGRSAGERLSVDPNRDSVLFFGSRDNGLWKSADYGTTWTKVDSFPVTGRTNGTGIVFTLFQRSSGRAGTPTPVIYVGVQQDGPGLYRSTDGGVSWQAVPGQPAGLLPHHGVLAQDGLYVTYGNAPGPNGMSAGAVWKMDTRTSVWTDISPIPAGGTGNSGYAGLAVDFQRPGTVMVGTMDRWNPGDTLFRSTDGGAHWHDIGPQSIRDSSLSPWVNFGDRAPKLGWWIGALAIDPFRSGRALYGTGATIWASEDVTQADRDQPTHWTVGALGLEETAVNDLISPPSGAHLVSALGDIGGFRHDDLTVSPRAGMWTHPSINGTESLDFAQGNPYLMARVGYGRPGQSGAFSQDNGATWTLFPAEPAGSKGGGTVALSADGSTIIWTPASLAPSFTHDRGATWTTCAGAPVGLSVISDRVNSNQFYGFDTHTGILYASADGGAGFSPKMTGLPTGGGKLRATPGREGDLWLAAGHALYHSTDGGAHFTKMGTAGEVHSLGFGRAAPGRTYPALYTAASISSVAGIFRSDDAGATWVRINDDQHQYGAVGVIIGDPRLYGRVYVGTNGRGIIYGELKPH